MNWERCPERLHELVVDEPPPLHAFTESSHYLLQMEHYPGPRDYCVRLMRYPRDEPVSLPLAAGKTNWSDYYLGHYRISDWDDALAIYAYLRDHAETFILQGIL